MPGYTKKTSQKMLLWNAEAKIAFHHMVNMIEKCPLLYFLQSEGQIVLETDASNYGVGRYLYQLVDGRELPIAFVSKSLSKSQGHWSVIQKEGYGIFYIVTS